ncbi:MAG: glycerol-3-phosphate 1-O-acyltransferase PlsY [Bacteroidota bacterium]
MDYWIAIAGIVAAYLIGSVSTAVYFGKLFYKVDVRQHGSGNAGATNTLRVLGNKAGLIVLLIDAFKGWLAVSLSDVLVTDSWTDESIVYFKIVLALVAVLGHIFPVYTRFKGGKGVATLLGVTVALFPYLLILILVGVFALVFGITKYVSLGSITVAIMLPVLAFFFFDVPVPLLVLAVVIAIIVPVTHRSNIKRLVTGEESRLSLKNNKAE